MRPDVTLEVVLRYLRRFDELPSQTDQLFVVDREETLLGVLPVEHADRQRPERSSSSGDASRRRSSCCSTRRPTRRRSAFERYDLVSAPVVDTNEQLVGRVTVDEVLDFVRESGEEDDAARRPACARRRTSSRRCGTRSRTAGRGSRSTSSPRSSPRASSALFEGSIEKLVALAALMPIVAGIGGNSGNQTITMIVRAVALGQVTVAQRATS